MGSTRTERPPEHGSDGTSRPGARRREQIIDAAIDAIARRGIGGATIGAIATDLGVSKGVITYHFPSRDVLLREAATFIYDSARDAMSSVIDHDSADAALRDYITSNLRWIAENPVYVTTLIALRTSAPPPVADHCAAEDATARTELEALFASLPAQRNLPAKPSALALRGAIDGYAIAAQHPPGVDPEVYATLLRRVFAEQADPGDRNDTDDSATGGDAP